MNVNTFTIKEFASFPSSSSCRPYRSHVCLERSEKRKTSQEFSRKRGSTRESSGISYKRKLRSIPHRVKTHTHTRSADRTWSFFECLTSISAVAPPATMRVPILVHRARSLEMLGIILLLHLLLQRVLRVLLVGRAGIADGHIL